MPPKDSTLQSSQDTKEAATVAAGVKPATLTAKPAIATARPALSTAKPASPARVSEPQVATAVSPATTRPKPKPAEVHNSKPAVMHPDTRARKPVPVKHAETRNAEVAKRVEAIKAWMAQRQATRDAARTHAAQ